MTVGGKAHGRSTSFAWGDAVGAAVLMTLMGVCGGLALGVVVVRLLELIGLPVEVDLGAIVHKIV